MAKQALTTKKTQIASQHANGQQVEQTYTVDDTCLPSPQELSAYQQLCPDILPFLLETSKKEQDHRHGMDKEKIKLLKSADRKTFSINLCGMFFAFVVMLLVIGLAAFLIYKDKYIVGTIFGTTSLLIAGYVFIPSSKRQKNK